jgi:hypothetical protein
MNGLSHRHALIAGLALIVIVNAIALGGVAFNRSGEDSRLHLGARELAAPYGSWQGLEEDSEMALRLVWRMPVTAGDEAAYPQRPPGWLDADKLAALGFPREAATETPRGGRQWVREVFLVLEFDGPAYRQGVAVLREKLARAQGLSAAHPDDKDLKRNAEAAAQVLERELRENSRLLVVDGGLDPAALRARYPDRARYALVRGRVRAALWSPHPSGYVEGVAVSNVHVPATFRRVFAGWPQRGKAAEQAFTADLAFGRRYEPWIVAISNGK